MKKPAKTAKVKVLTPAQRTKWFQEARFGMFIHWGLYALPARHEWVRHGECITNEDYEKYFENFDPDLFNPKEWAKAAREAGMKYFVITTKHHEGFCLFDSKFTDYKATNTQAKRDLLREVVDAFRAEGLKIGFYYSLLDWHHPEFPIDNIHPLRNREDWKELNKTRDVKKYAKYMRDQVTELLTNYGPVDILWFDFSYPTKPTDKLPGKGRDDWESEKLYKLVRKLAPNVIIDNRLDLPGSGDIQTPEQFQPSEPLRNEDGSLAVWEGCQTFSGSWGYHRDELTWKTDKQCIEMLIRHVAANGNLIMNVGPTARGYLDYRAMDRLKAYGEWMKYHRESIYGCGVAPDEFPAPNGCRYTYNAKTKRLYLHILDWPFRHITLEGLAGKVKYAQFLHDDSEVGWTERKEMCCGHGAVPEGAITIQLPVVQPNVLVPVVEIILK